MSVIINVFYRGKDYEMKFIERLIKHDFVHYVDCTRFRDETWLKENTVYGDIFKLHENRGSKIFPPYVEKLEEEEEGVFVLIGYVDQDFHPTEYEIVSFMETMGNVDDLSESDLEWELEFFLDLFRMNPALNQINAVPIEIPTKKRSIDEVDKLETSGYTFEYYYMVDQDAIFYQLTKPNVDRPYVVLTRDFSKHGYERLFSSMRMFETWCFQTDMQFLYAIWKHLKFIKPLDLDGLLDKHVDAVIAGEREPDVYRDTMDKVIEKFIAKNKKV